MLVHSQQRKLRVECCHSLWYYPLAIIWIFWELLSLTLHCFSTQKCFPLSVPLGSPQYTSELGMHPLKSCRVYLCPTRGESRYGAYAMCHPVFSELVKDPAVLLIWSGLRPSTAHQFYLIYIPEPTLHFYVRNQWEKDPYRAPGITRKK